MELKWCLLAPVAMLSYSCWGGGGGGGLSLQFSPPPPPQKMALGVSVFVHEEGALGLATSISTGLYRATVDLYPMGDPRDALDITYPLPNGLKEGWRCQESIA